ncbi:MAG TPA: DUF3999 family protein [Vicinamibacterales bacterium]|nr:DUF3999 family protein [Vicinamibacterales bacterium]
MSRGRWVALIVLCTVAVLGAQPSNDQARSAWRYRRAVTPPQGADNTLVAVTLPPEVHARSQPALRDLRLIDATGREVPYLIQEDTARRVERRWSGYLTESQRERRAFSTWTVDFGEVIVFDRLQLDLPGLDFSKRLSIDISVDGASWRELGRDYWVFDRVWQSTRLHDTTLHLPATEARFARLQTDDGTSAPMEIRGVMALRTDDLAGASWTRDVGLELVSSDGGRSRYRLTDSEGLPVRRLAIDADDPTFARNATVLEQGRDDSIRIGGGQIYRVRLPGTETALESREIDVTRQGNGALLLEMENADSPPLQNPRLRVWGPRTVLLTTPTASALTLYYGNGVTRAPVYDLEQFRLALAIVPEFPEASVGPENENPAFRQPAPLAFVAARGATVPTADWRFSRSLAITGNEDLYTLTVPALDLARLRADLGDLRIVDDADRQVPYVLERDSSTATVPLTVAAATPRGNKRQTSAFKLVAPATPDGRALPLVTAVRLRIREPFFERRVTILQPRGDAPLGAVTIATATLASGRHGDRTEPASVQLQVGAPLSSEWWLEIADGDNAPLTLLEAQAVVPVPRVTFKAAPGTYRLLLGNTEAAAPSYELGVLRQEVLAYAAVPLNLGDSKGEEINPAYQRDLADYVRDAPPRVVLWTTLGVAVLALLFLTRRIVRRSPPPPGA